MGGWFDPIRRLLGWLQADPEAATEQPHIFCVSASPNRTKAIGANPNRTKSITASPNRTKPVRARLDCGCNDC
jgi:hypothetical protein